MRPETGSLELAHARIAARWGDRPEEGLWRRIQITRPLAAVLDLARASALSGWIGSLDAATDLHRIDRQFRLHWRRRVDEVAGWMPACWQPALLWCASAADLPAWDRWAHGGPLPAWMTDDAPLARMTEPGAQPDTEPTRRFAKAVRREPAWLLRHWIASWRALLPRVAPARAIERILAPPLQQHLAAFTAPDAVDGWAMRRELEARLSLLWRRHPAEPVAAFIHLALVALEGERLRGELARRAAFPDRALAA